MGEIKYLPGFDIDYEEPLNGAMKLILQIMNPKKAQNKYLMKFQNLFSVSWIMF